MAQQCLKTYYNNLLLYQYLTINIRITYVVITIYAILLGLRVYVSFAFFTNRTIRFFFWVRDSWKFPAKFVLISAKNPEQFYMLLLDCTKFISNAEKICYTFAEANLNHDLFCIFLVVKTLNNSIIFTIHTYFHVYLMLFKYY